MFLATIADSKTAASWGDGQKELKKWEADFSPVRVLGGIVFAL